MCGVAEYGVDRIERLFKFQVLEFSKCEPTLQAPFGKYVLLF
jgi:hypothetical protein